MGIIELKNVSYRYPTADDNIIKGISLSIEKGKLYSIIGANGSGKTTLGNIIRGFAPNFYKGEISGEVLIKGKNIKEYEPSDLAFEMGYVFQNPFTQISGARNTVFEELAYGLENMGIEPEEIRTRVEKVMEVTNTTEFRDRSPYQLSGGQQQRVAFASILVMEQDILIIDEPTSQLDPESTNDIFDIIQVSKNEGKTVILIEHKLEQIAQYADYIFVLENGRIAMEGSPSEVFRNKECLKHGISLPKVSMIGMEMMDKGFPLKQIPITVDEIANEIKNYMLQKRGY